VSHFTGNLTSIETIASSSAATKNFRLQQNYPNPFNPRTTIEYHIPESVHVRLTIYDLLGRQIRTLVNTRQQAGHLKTIWDGTDGHNVPVSAGVYFCQMETADFVDMIKLALVR